MYVVLLLAAFSFGVYIASDYNFDKSVSNVKLAGQRAAAKFSAFLDSK